MLSKHLIKHHKQYLSGQLCFDCKTGISLSLKGARGNVCSVDGVEMGRCYWQPVMRYICVYLYIMKVCLQF